MSFGDWIGSSLREIDMFESKAAQKFLNSSTTNSLVALCALFLIWAPILSAYPGIIPFLKQVPEQSRNILMISAQLSVLIFFVLAIVSNTRMKQISFGSISYMFPQICVENGSYRSVYIRALNGLRFAEYLQRSEVTIQQLHLLLPTNKAINEFYNNTKSDSSTRINLVTDYEKTISIIQMNKNLTIDIFKQLEATGKITNFLYSEVDAFSLDFCAIANRGEACITGRYTPKRERAVDSGLASSAWIEYSSYIKSKLTDDFEQLKLCSFLVYEGSKEKGASS